ncbi:MAG: ribokinase [Bacilli bacterium]
MSKRIYLLGSINVDISITTPYIPKQGETLTGSNFFMAGGGKGANQAVAIKRMGVDLSFLSCVGNDAFAKEQLNNLKNEGIDTKNIKQLKDANTGSAIILLCNNDNRIILNPAANIQIKKEDIISFLKDAKEEDIFLTQLENNIDATSFALEYAKEQKKMTVILNPAPMNKNIIDYLKFVDILIPNETELELLGGLDYIKSNNVKTLIVTLGSKGYRLIDNNKDEIYPAIKIKPVDTTSAGDTFVGIFTALYSNGESIETASKFASIGASIACLSYGAQPSIPTKEKIEDYIKHNL